MQHPVVVEFRGLCSLKELHRFPESSPTLGKVRGQSLAGCALGQTNCHPLGTSMARPDTPVLTQVTREAVVGLTTGLWRDGQAGARGQKGLQGPGFEGSGARVVIVPSPLTELKGTYRVPTLSTMGPRGQQGTEASLPYGASMRGCLQSPKLVPVIGQSVSPPGCVAAVTGSRAWRLWGEAG